MHQRHTMLPAMHLPMSVLRRVAALYFRQMPSIAPRRRCLAASSFEDWLAANPLPHAARSATPAAPWSNDAEATSSFTSPASISTLQRAQIQLPDGDDAASAGAPLQRRRFHVRDLASQLDALAAYPHVFWHPESRAWLAYDASEQLRGELVLPRNALPVAPGASLPAYHTALRRRFQAVINQTNANDGILSSGGVDGAEDGPDSGGESEGGTEGEGVEAWRRAEAATAAASTPASHLMVLLSAGGCGRMM